MKVITKTVEVTVYVSNDGKEFKRKENCFYYEERVIPLMRSEWKDKVFKDLKNFVDSCDSNNKIPLCNTTSIIGNFVFYQNSKERITTIINVRTGRIGKAICNHGDIFNRKMGWAIAWARYKGDEIPEYI